MTTSCGTISVGYCCSNDDAAWFVYQSGNDVPNTVSFAAGQLLDGDGILIHYGLDQSAQLAFGGNLGGQLAGSALSGSNADKARHTVVERLRRIVRHRRGLPQLLWTLSGGLAGMDRSIDTGIRVFPNPAQDQARVVLPANASGPVSIEVSDPLGPVASTTRVPARSLAFDVQVGQVAPGQYWLRITAGASIWTVPLMVSLTGRIRLSTAHRSLVDRAMVRGACE